MNNELLELLRSVLKEELEPFNKRFDGIEQEIRDLKTGQERFQKNIIWSLEQYTEKIADHVDD
jgi:hemerythrin-like domain-containing protein